MQLYKNHQPRYCQADNCCLIPQCRNTQEAFPPAGWAEGKASSDEAKLCPYLIPHVQRAGLVLSSFWFCSGSA